MKIKNRLKQLTLNTYYNLDEIGYLKINELMSPCLFANVILIGLLLFLAFIISFASSIFFIFFIIEPYNNGPF